MEKKSIAIITAGFTPVPAVNGGAVEKLTTILVEQNEYEDLYDIDVYTIYDPKIDSFSYKSTTIVKIKISRIERFIEKNINRLMRLLKINNNFVRYRRKAYKEFEKRIRRHSYDYILFENSREMIPMILKADINNTKLYLHLHNNSSSPSLNKSIDLCAANNMAGVIGVSKYIKNDFIAISGIRPSKVRVLYNCVDSSMSENIKERVDSLRKSLYIDNRDFVFLYVGRINYEKGVHVLAKAFSQINTPFTKLIICGGTWENEFKDNRYLKTVKKLLGKNLKKTLFVGHIQQTEIMDYYNLCNAVVIPSIVQEAFGMVMLEASLMGKPCIATKSGGMTEILSNKNAVWLDINKGLSEKISHAMNKMTKDYTPYKAMGERALAEVSNRKEFFDDGYLDRLAEIITS